MEYILHCPGNVGRLFGADELINRSKAKRREPHYRTRRSFNAKSLSGGRAQRILAVKKNISFILVHDFGKSMNQIVRRPLMVIKIKAGLIYCWSENAYIALLTGLFKTEWRSLIMLVWPGSTKADQGPITLEMSAVGCRLVLRWLLPGSENNRLGHLR